MPRIARGLADGCIYHVLNRGNARQAVFHCDDDYLEFAGLLVRSKERFAIRLHAYCPISLPGEWTRFVALPLTGYERERLTRSLMRQSPYGTLDWIERVGLELGVGGTLRNVGRPRKH